MISKQGCALENQWVGKAGTQEPGHARPGMPHSNSCVADSRGNSPGPATRV